MTPKRSTLERAFELARTGECRIVTDLIMRLKAEGYMDIDHHLHAGCGLREQLAKLCKQAWDQRMKGLDGPATRPPPSRAAPLPRRVGD